MKTLGVAILGVGFIYLLLGLLGPVMIASTGETCTQFRARVWNDKIEPGEPLTPAERKDWDHCTLQIARPTGPAGRPMGMPR